LGGTDLFTASVQAMNGLPQFIRIDELDGNAGEDERHDAESQIMHASA